MTVTAAEAAEVLPGYACVEYSGALGRIFGWIEERTVGGARFLEVQVPRGVARQLINARQVRTITVCSAETAERFAPQNWRNGR